MQRHRHRTMEETPTPTPPVQIFGLSKEPISLQSTQFHGDWAKLAETPEAFRLFIRPERPPAMQPSTWTPFNGRQLPCPVTVHSPSIFRDRVYDTIHDALFACLLWFNGGISGALRYDFYPTSEGDNDRFPLVRLYGPPPHELGLALEPPTSFIGLHFAHMEPTHGQLLALGRRLRDLGYQHCMLIVGSLLPKKRNPLTDSPPLRGILLHAALLVPNPGAEDAFPIGAVEHGWVPCLGGAAMTLRFGMHGQDETRAMPPAAMPPLHTYDYRLWKRGNSCFCIHPRTAAVDGADWDACIKSHMEKDFEAHHQETPAPEPEPRGKRRRPDP